MKNMVIHSRLIGLALTGWLLGSVAGVQAAGPWYVATNGADSGNNGLSWSQPFVSVSNALIKASASDTIWVSNGVYTLTASINNDSTKKCKIRAMSTNARDTVFLGPGSNDVTSYRGVYIAGAGSLLEGFTVTNFYLTNAYYGAGVELEVSAIMSNCIITGNINAYPAEAAKGGGVNIGNAGASMGNCDVIGNSVTWSATWYGSGGGGISVESTGGRVQNCRILGNNASHGFDGGIVLDPITDSSYTSILQDSVVASNTGSYGGGIACAAGATVSNCLVFSNTAKQNGGGLNSSANLAGRTNTITKCVFSNNDGPNAGGIAYYPGYGHGGRGTVSISDCRFDNNRSASAKGTALYFIERKDGGTILIRNCLVANHTVSASAAAISVAVTNALIENCTIASNTTASSGAVTAGLYVTNAITVLNSIIYHNLKAGGEQANVIASADCAFSNSCITPTNGLAGTGNTEADPLFVAKETDNFRLAGNSPCINTGMYQAWMANAVDLDGRARIRYGAVDMGAYECLLEGAIFMFH